MAGKKPKKLTQKQVKSKLKTGKYVTIPMADSKSFEQVVDRDDHNLLIGYVACIDVECDRLYSTTSKDFKTKLFDHEMFHRSQKLQKHFEADVNTLKDQCEKLDLVSTSTCNLSTYNNNSNTTKHLPLACGYLKKQYLSKWIPNECNVSECTRSGGDKCDHTCYNLKDHHFEYSNKLYLLAVKACNNGRKDVSNFTAIAIMEKIFDEKTTNCKLQVTVYEKETNIRHRFISYIKRVGPSRLSKSMDISQNDNRISLGSEVYYKISEGVLFRMSCLGSVIGVGPYDLVGWRAKGDEEKKDDLINAFEPESIHLMIYIYDSFESMLNIDIAVGHTQDVAINNVGIHVIGTHLQKYNGKLTLYPSPSNTNVNCSNHNNHNDPSHNNLAPHSIISQTNHQLPSAQCYVVVPESAPLNFKEIEYAVYVTDMYPATISNASNGNSDNMSNITTNTRQFQSSNGFGSNENRIHHHLRPSNVRERREIHIQEMRRNTSNYRR